MKFGQTDLAFRCAPASVRAYREAVISIRAKRASALKSAMDEVKLLLRGDPPFVNGLEPDHALRGL
jgi:hypothetical protein